MISLGSFLNSRNFLETTPETLKHTNILTSTGIETKKVVEAIKSRGTHFGFDSPGLSRAESTKKPTEFTYHPPPSEIKNKLDAHIYENSGLQSISGVKFNSDKD